MTDQPITWTEAREELAELHSGLEHAHRMATLAVLSPHESVRGDRVHIDAFADLHERVEHLLGRAERLLERVAESSPPARQLEAVLADIVAEGHTNAEVHRRASTPRWFVRSDNGSARWPGSDSGREHIDAYYAAVEHGEAEVDGGDIESAVKAAEARLAQIRELREQQRAAVVALVDTFACLPIAFKYGLSAGDFMTPEELVVEEAENGHEAFTWAGFLPDFMNLEGYGASLAEAREGGEESR